LDSGGHGETVTSPDADQRPEFFKEHETIETDSDTFQTTSQPVAISNGQATCGL